jgi:hypothetical protein
MPLQPEDLRSLKLQEITQAEAILAKYNAMDVPRENVVEFAAHLLHRRDSWFVEAGDVGLFYLTHIIPRLSANFNMVFWDRKLGGDRRELAKLVLSKAFDLFALRRVAMSIAEPNLPLRKTAMKIGFMPEGIVRQSTVIGDAYFDTYNFGLLREEATWPVLTTSLD